MKTQNPASGLGAGGQNVAGYVGEIVYFADSILRKNHVWADGAPVDAAQWPELAAYAETAGWQQNDAGQYLTPDLRGRFLLGASEKYPAGKTGGEEEHALTQAEGPSHNHPVQFSEDGGITWNNTIIGRDGKSTSNSYLGTQNSVQNYTDFQTRIGYSGQGNPHNNMPPYFTANPQIRARVDVVNASVDAITQSTAADFADGTVLGVSGGLVTPIEAKNITGKATFNTVWIPLFHMSGIGICGIIMSLKSPTLSSFSIFNGTWNSVSIENITIRTSAGYYTIAVSSPDILSKYEVGRCYLGAVSYSI